MSKFIYQYENDDLLKQMKYYVLSNLSSERPYYICAISNETYNNFQCYFLKNLTFMGNRFSTTDSEYKYLSAMLWSDGHVAYNFYTRTGVSTIYPYSAIVQDLFFTNVANYETGLIDIAYEYKFNQNVESTTSSSSSDVISNNTWLFFISAILVLIVIRDFIHYSFRKR